MHVFAYLISVLICLYNILRNRSSLCEFLLQLTVSIVPEILLLSLFYTNYYLSQNHIPLSPLHFSL